MSVTFQVCLTGSFWPWYDWKGFHAFMVLELISHNQNVKTDRLLNKLYKSQHLKNEILPKRKKKSGISVSQKQFFPLLPCYIMCHARCCGRHDEAGPKCWTPTQRMLNWRKQNWTRGKKVHNKEKKTLPEAVRVGSDSNSEDPRPIDLENDNGSEEGTLQDPNGRIQKWTSGNLDGGRRQSGLVDGLVDGWHLRPHGLAGAAAGSWMGSPEPPADVAGCSNGPETTQGALELGKPGIRKTAQPHGTTQQQAEEDRGLNS